MANALKKIITAAKKIHKKGGTWKGAVKKASVMYRGGKLKAKKRRAVGAVKKTRKRTTVKRRATSRKRSTRKRAVAKRTVVVVAGTRTRKRRRSYSRKAAPRRRRVGASGKDKFIQTLVIGGLAVGLIVAFTRSRQQQTTYVPTGDPYRDSKAQQILSYAQAAGATIQQISNLINTINQSSNSQLDSIDASVRSGGTMLAGRLNYN